MTNLAEYYVDVAQWRADRAVKAYQEGLGDVCCGSCRENYIHIDYAPSEENTLPVLEGWGGD